MAGRLGIERESVYRMEREPHRVNEGKQAAYAAALGEPEIAPEQLWQPPGTRSLDAMVSGAPADVRALAEDLVERLVAGRRR
jgi:hypothetical protein